MCYSNPFDQPKMGLLLIILATIFMKDNVVTEGIELKNQCFHLDNTFNNKCFHSLSSFNIECCKCFCLEILWDTLKILGVIKG